MEAKKKPVLNSSASIFPKKRKMGRMTHTARLSTERIPKKMRDIRIFIQAAFFS